MAKTDYGAQAVSFVVQNSHKRLSLPEIRNKLQWKLQNPYIGIKDFRSAVMKAVREGKFLSGKDSRGRVWVQLNPNHELNPQPPEPFEGVDNPLQLMLMPMQPRQKRTRKTARNLT